MTRGGLAKTFFKKTQARKKSANPNFRVRVSSSGGGGFPRKGAGGFKKFGMSFETLESQTFGRDIPGLLLGYPKGQGRPKSLRQNS